MNRWTSVRLLGYIYSDGLQPATRPSEPSGFFARAGVSGNSEYSITFSRPSQTAKFPTLSQSFTVAATLVDISEPV